jgi:GT2 family glycosyltransferase
VQLVLDIVMPYYGDVALMQAAVNSVIAQTDDRWRLTVVDDGTAPGVPEWFDSLNHPNIRYERNQRNLGVTGNFQKCLNLAEYEFMVMIGSDDLLLPNYVNVVHDLIDRFPQATIVQPGVQVIDGVGRPARTLVDWAKKNIYAPRFTGIIALRGEELAVSLLRGDWLYFPSLCWRTSAIAAVGFDERLAVIQDLNLLLRLVRNGAELVASDQVCFQYRRHAVSKSSADAVTGSRFAEARLFFLDAAVQMQEQGWPKAASAARWHVSSRLFALTLLPAAALNRNVAGARTLTAHTFGSLRPR